MASSPVFAGVAAFAAGVLPPAAAPAALCFSFLCFFSSCSLWSSSGRRLTLSPPQPFLRLLRREQGPRIPVTFPERLLPAAAAAALHAHPPLSLGLGLQPSPRRLPRCLQLGLNPSQGHPLYAHTHSRVHTPATQQQRATAAIRAAANKEATALQ